MRDEFINHSSMEGVAENVIDEVIELKRQLSRARESLDALKCELQQITQYAGHGIRVINRDFTIRYINQAFARISGVTPEEAAGKTCWEVFPGPFCHTPNCRLVRILSGEKLIQAEIERPGPDGNKIPCIVNAVPFYSKTGDIIGVSETFTDITEKRELQARVSETEERYRALIELGTEAGEAIVMLQDIGGREGIQTFVSDQWLLITGYTREELLDSCFFDLVAESDRHGSIERHRMKMSGISVPGLYKMKIRRKDGLDVVVEVTGAFTNYLGKRSNVLYIRDITERILAEEKLRDSEDRYHSLFDEVPVAIWELDYSAIKIFLDSLRAQGINIRNYFYQHPETTLYCLKLGKGYGVNQAAVELWDAESTEELVNGIFDLIQKRPGGLERDRENIIAMAEGATEINYVNCDPTFKGELKYTSVKYRIAPGHENDWSRVFGSFFDITERIEAEKELQAYQEHLKDIVDERTSQLKQEVSRSRLMEEKVRELYNKEIQLRCEMEEQINRRIRFTRAVVHELKTPLTPLLGATELLAGNLREDPWDKLAQQSHRGALELNRRIDDLFDLTRNEIGTLKLNYTWADPITIVQQLIDITNLQCQASGHVLCLDIPDSLPQVYCDPQRLKQVLNNLIDNACKYTQPGTKIMLHISLENNALLFRVEDSGPGIAEDKQKEIFAPYSKIEKQREHYSGLGLGLSICKTFVNLHGGEIFLESKPGAGSCFAFTIPISGRDSTR